MLGSKVRTCSSRTHLGQDSATLREPAPERRCGNSAHRCATRVRRRSLNTRTGCSRESPAAALPGHDQVNGKVWAGAPAVGAGMAKRAGGEREPLAGETDRHRVLQARPRQIETALAEGAARMDSNSLLHTAAPLGDTPLVVVRRARASITWHFGRKHRRPSLNCRRTAV